MTSFLPSGLQFDHPDMPANVPGKLFETRLSVEDTINLIDRLVGHLTYLKGLARPDPVPGR